MDEEDFPEKGMNTADRRWIANLPDELDVFIAQREFESAVAYMEKGKLFLKQISDLFQFCVDHLQ